MKSLLFIFSLLAFSSYGMAGNIAVYDPSRDDGYYILTPAEKPEPQINGPSVFGVRPGSPFLYTIPASGARPVEFSVEGLPEGLTLDESTGQITGTMISLEKKSYPLVFRAQNEHGSAEKNFEIIVGDTICLTPPLGWNSWNCWGHAVDQEKVTASARAMVDKGLINYGWTYINIDDTWQGLRGGEYNAIQSHPEKFPDMRQLCDDIHSMGLKIGIYSTPWITSYAGYIGTSSDHPAGEWSEALAGEEYWRTGQFQFEKNDAAQWADWGVDYLKYDWYPNDPENIRRMSVALEYCGRDIVYSLSNSALQEHGEVIKKFSNCWRSVGDLKDRWDEDGKHCSLTEAWEQQRRWLAECGGGGPGHFPDADMLVVGHVIADNENEEPRPSRLTADEQYTHISLWSLWSSPMLIGCPIEMMDTFTLKLLTNSEVLDIHQDKLAYPGMTVMNQDDIEVIVKDLADGSKAFGLFNRKASDQPVTVDWDLLGLSGKQVLRDVWRQQDIGTYKDSFSAIVPSHGVVLIQAR